MSLEGPTTAPPALTPVPGLPEHPHNLPTGGKSQAEQRPPGPRFRTQPACVPTGGGHAPAHMHYKLQVAKLQKNVFPPLNKL